MKCLVIFWSKYGQTEKIATRIADKLRSGGAHADVQSAAGSSKGLEYYDVVVAGSPIYYAKHSKAVNRFVSENLATLNQKVTAFYSVSLSAGGNQKQKEDANQCVDKHLKELGWNPTVRAIFGGGLPYRKYSWITRMLMKWISSREGGDTDTARDFEYTDWNAVDTFARDLLANAFAAKENKANKAELSLGDPAVNKFVHAMDLERPAPSR